MALWKYFANTCSPGSHDRLPGEKCPKLEEWAELPRLWTKSKGLMGRGLGDLKISWRGLKPTAHNLHGSVLGTSTKTLICGRSLHLQGLADWRPQGGATPCTLQHYVLYLARNRCCGPFWACLTSEETLLVTGSHVPKDNYELNLLILLLLSCHYSWLNDSCLLFVGT